MIRLSLLFFLTGLTAAMAQDAFPAFGGQYGSASDPQTSCATNPHELSFMSEPPHAIFTWAQTWTDDDGMAISDRRYDLLDHSDTTLTLRLEGDTRRTDTGARPIWILRQTSQPDGYCWGRTDWPSVHCEDQQVRCEKATS